MKKRLLVLTLAMLLFLLSFSGCTRTRHYSYQSNDVSSVEIVRVLRSEDNGIEDELIGKIDNVEDFLKDFEKVDFHSMMPPRDFYPMSLAIKIIGKDGTVQYISPYGSYSNKATGSYIFYGNSYADERAYSNLLQKYTKTVSIPMNYVFCEQDDCICSIEIVELGETSQIETIICQVDQAAFFEKFKEVDCRMVFTPPQSAAANSKAIKITYAVEATFGGTIEIIELISSSGQSYGEKGNSFVNCGYYSFNEEQFNDLLSFFERQ